MRDLTFNHVRVNRDLLNIYASHFGFMLPHNQPKQAFQSNRLLHNFRPLFGAQKKPSPLTQSKTKTIAALNTLEKRASLKEKQVAHQRLSSAFQHIYTAKEQNQLNKVTELLRHQLVPAGIEQTIKHLTQQGYQFYFPDDELYPWQASGLNILTAYEDVSERAEQALEEDESVTVAEILKESKDIASYIHGGSLQEPGYFLFSTSKHNIAPSTFWHEVTHALQHQHQMYNFPDSQPQDFIKREMEASHFVITHANLLQLSNKELTRELKIWGLRLKEYLDYTHTLDIVA